MAISLAPGLSLSDSVVPMRTLWFFRYKLRRAFLRFILAEFDRLQQNGEYNRKWLARRIHRKNASIVTRWFTAPGNLGLDSISDLLVGMAIDPTTLLVEEPLAAVSPVIDLVTHEHSQPERRGEPPLPTAKAENVQYDPAPTAHGLLRATPRHRDAA